LELLATTQDDGGRTLERTAHSTPEILRQSGHVPINTTDAHFQHRADPAKSEKAELAF
jgi:hypothetical protein